MEFKEVKLGDVVEFKNGKKRPKEKGSVPIYGGNGILGYTNKSNSPQNSLIIGRVGAYCGCVYKNDTECWISDNAIVGYARENNSYSFLYYYLKSLNLHNLHIGSGHPLMTQDILNNIKIKIPNYNIQLKIGKILENIDKKVELNNKINANLFHLGDVLYKELYENKYKTTDDWQICKLRYVAENYDAKRKPMSSREREEHQGKYPYYGATSIIDYVEDYIFDGTYLLMGEDGTVVTDDDKPVLQYIWGKNWVNNHAHILRGTKISTEHLMFCLRNTNVRDIITGAVQPKINQENMNNINIIFGNKETNQIFEKIINSLMKQYKNIVEENKRLTDLRDSLLPKLMNGEINLDKIKN